MSSADAFLANMDMSVYPTVFDPATLQRKGLCPVTKIAAKNEARSASSTASTVLPTSHSIYFEIHGDGPQKVLLIMGLNATCFAWKSQVKFLNGIKQDDGSHRFSVLVFDNRGVGNSDTPRGPYSTSEMANDVIILLDYVGWTAPRQLFVMGGSMGGMIALELASMIQSRIISLILLVTSAGGFGLASLLPWKGLVALTRLTFTKDLKTQVAILVNLMFPGEFLKGPAVEYDQPAITNYDYIYEELFRRMKLQRRQPLTGALSQMWAGLTHNVSAKRLAKIEASIPKICIVTGDEDHLVRPQNSYYLKKCMPTAEFIALENTGHIPWSQHPRFMEATILRVFAEGLAKTAAPNQ